MTDFALVCEEISTTGDHEEFFNKKFDQLEKLHELYKSVSSISAKSQSRLELNRNKILEEFGNQNLLSGHQRSASFSLTGLLGDLDNISIQSSVSDDLASLCSEPAWVSRQGSTFLDINKNTSSFTSLSSLIPPKEDNSVASSEIVLEEEVRSHSPVLEGMDSQLAKYAQLKDLEVAYQLLPLGGQAAPQPLMSPVKSPLPPQTTPSPLQVPPSALCRLADGASDPDSDPSPPSKRSQGAVTLPRRSPGTGRSSSSSELEELVQKHKELSLSSVDCGRIVRASSETRPVGADNIVATKLVEKKLEPDKEVKEQEAPQGKEKSRVIPRFSRLFGGMRRISRSPSQITSKGNEDKIRSKASKRQTKTSQISLEDSSPLKIEKVIPEKPTKTKHKFFSSKDKCSTKSPIHISSKNVKGTLSSEPSCERAKDSIKVNKGHKSPGRERRDKSKTRSQGVTAATLVPSPYSTPSHVKTRPVVQSETSGSGYDSGIESGIVRVRGKGAERNMTTVREHCKSSGYESFGLDCESLSLGSGDSPAASSPTLPILKYNEQTVHRMDRTWRFQEIKRLKKRQEELKTELSSAKARINCDPSKWSYELHTEESGMESTDPNFVEAFERETAILDKRVQACRSHVVVSTTFDGQRKKEERGAFRGCTADCEWVQEENVPQL